ncbi:unnamed protein product [Musa textilis]
MSIASVLSVVWKAIAIPGFGGIHNFSSVEFEEVVGSEPVTQYARTKPARRHPKFPA